MMNNHWTGKFSIVDFYLSVCDKAVINAYVPEHLQLIDVGKLETIEKAERFLKNMEN
jgi:hypothetical protein